MKVKCKCGYLVPDSETTDRYRWMETRDWTRLFDTVDDVILRCTGDPAEKERLMMEVRSAAPGRLLWECPSCHRLIAFAFGGNEITFLKIEDVWKGAKG